MKKEFNVGDKVIYPSYGLGTVSNIESHTIYGIETKVYVISFDHDKVVLKVPFQKSSMLRVPMEQKDIHLLYDILRQPPDSARNGIKTNQIYETRIRSGDLCLVAKTARDIYKRNVAPSTTAPKANASYSYNQKRILDLAIKLIADEIAQAENINIDTAKERIINILNS